MARTAVAEPMIAAEEAAADPELENTQAVAAQANEQQTLGTEVTAATESATPDVRSQLKAAHKEVMTAHKRREKALTRLGEAQVEVDDATAHAQATAVKYSDLMAKVTAL